jgi:DNA polymerase
MAPDRDELNRLRRVVAQKLELARLYGVDALPPPRVQPAASAAKPPRAKPTAPVPPAPAPGEPVAVGESLFEKRIERSGSHSPEEKRAMLDAIAEQIAHCTQCPLHEGRRNTVPGEGNPDARLLFIGEGPGEQEDLQGRPFVGRAGHLLDRMILAMGLQREDVFIGNIIKCRPPENRAPSLIEAETCIPYLEQQIEVIAPEVIVALGATAAKFLLNTRQGINKLRATWHSYRGIPVMPTYHPAYLLRAYTKENRRKVWDDLLKVCTKLGLTPPKKSQ